MQVERFLNKNIPLISSSFILTVEITEITIRKFPRRSILIYRLKAQLKDSVWKILKTTAGLERSPFGAFSATTFTISVTVTVMASIVKTEDNLATPKPTPAAALAPALTTSSAQINVPDGTANREIKFTSISDNIRPYKNKQSSDPDPATTERKRKKFARGGDSQSDKTATYKNYGTNHDNDDVGHDDNNDEEEEEEDEDDDNDEEADENDKSHFESEQEDSYAPATSPIPEKSHRPETINTNDEYIEKNAKNSEGTTDCTSHNDENIVTPMLDPITVYTPTPTLTPTIKPTFTSTPTLTPTPVDAYIAPEQALVTSVELVVPAPGCTTISTSASASASVSALAAVPMQYNDDLSFNASNNANANENDKTNGCETESSSTSLNERIPNKLASDILTTERRGAVAIWAPHGEYKDNQSANEHASRDDERQRQNHLQIGGVENLYEKHSDRLQHNSEGDPSRYQSDIYRTHPQHQQHHQQEQSQPAELLLHIEKETAGSVGFGQMLPTLQHHHHNLTEQHFAQAQQQQHLLQSQHQNQLQSSMYAQMLEQQQQHQQQQQHLQHPQHQPHLQQQQNHHHHQQQEQQHHVHTLHHQNIHEQQIHYANYSSQHYSHDQLFAMHHTHSDQSHHHQPLHHQEEQQQRQHIELQTHLQQQQRLPQQQQHQQQQMQEAYHDLMMDEFHEDPNSAFKLTLSPNNVKPENQDDGYETSAGDVLTPNSHSSSIHSITPQHQMQHGNHGHVIQNNNQDELIGLQNPNPNPNANCHTQTQTHTHPNLNPNPNQSQNLTDPSTSNSPQVQSSNTQDSVAHLSTISQRDSNSVALLNDPYSFMGEEMNMLSPDGRPATAVNVSNYTPTAVSVPGMPSDSVSNSGVASASNSISACSATSGDLNQPNDLYSAKHQQHHQQLLVQPTQQQHLASNESFSDSHDMEASTQSLDADNSNSDNLNPRSVSGPVPKRRGRKKKLAISNGMQMIVPAQCADNDCSNSNLMTVGDILTMKPKERKKHDRFNGMSESEVIKRTIPDHLCDNLDIVIVGINPGLFAAYKGHHYAGPGNHFWKCLYLSGLTEEQMSADDDHTLLKHGIGFTNMVARATKGSADLTRKEIKEGSRILLEKLQRFRPKVAVFNGKLIFEVFSGKKEFHFGRQPDRVDGTDTYVWVMPSSSARCAQLPRAADKVPFYGALKKFRDFLNGQITQMDESECVFTEQRIRQCCEQQQQQEPVPKVLPMGNTSASSKPNTNPNSNDKGHSNTIIMEQLGATDQQQSSLMFVDNIVDGSSNNIDHVSSTECSNHFNTNLSNVIPRDGFHYGGVRDEPMRGGPNLISGSSLVSQQQQTSYLPVFSNQQQAPPEKKKRGRPKKIKEQEMIGPGSSTTTKMTLSGGQQMPQHDFNNILNLSMMAVTGSSGNSGPGVGMSAEMATKKKRGRPKKLKPTMENMVATATSTVAATATTTATTVKPQVNADTSQTGVGMHSLSIEHTASPQNSHQAPPSLYNTPPPSHILYTASASPMASPALNCNSHYSHSHGTPPVSSSGQVDLLIDSAGQNQAVIAAATASVRDQPHLGETPPPTSPNMCAVVDFEPPNHDQETGCLHMSQQSTAGDDTLSHRQDHYQQWLSPSHQQHQHPLQQSAQKTLQSQSQSQSSPHYPGANPLDPLHYHQTTEQSEHWQRYDENNTSSSSYILTSPQHQQQEQHLNLGHVVTDVSRKSLSGLESLVDQIPSISEQESNSISSATAAAAAAAVENRLLGLQQQQQQQKRLANENDNGQSETIGNSSNNNNFTVSNLAASSVDHNSSNNSVIRPENGINNTNSSSTGSSAVVGGEYPNHTGTGCYPHPHVNHYISAALVAATAGNTQAAATAVATQQPQQLQQQHPHQIGHPHAHPHSHPHSHPHAHPHAHPHPQMYMDHAHITSMYGPSPYGPTQHTATSPDYGHGPYSVQGSPGTLHVPSPNYPYAHYGHAAPPQTNYPAFAHPHHSHAHPHPHPHHGHLSVFERLKPSDISGYSGF